MALLPARLRARLRLRRVGLWHHSGYRPALLAASARAPHLALERVEDALGQLASEGLVRPGDLRRPRPARWAQLLRVHTPDYLESTTHAETLARIFGLEESEADVESLLLAQRLATGGTVAAVRAVCSRRLRVGVNLGGGFHHAEHDRGGGFCVYNDVAVAIAALRARGDRRRVAVVDLDYHQGDGTRALFAADPSVLTFSIHGSTWSDAVAQADVGLELPGRTGDAEYVAALKGALPPALEQHRPELVVLLTGHDVLEGDALGDFALTPAGCLRRDRVVIEWARARHVPLAIAMAGGYGRAGSVALASLLRWLLVDDDTPPGPPAVELRRHFARVAAQLDPAELQADPGAADWQLSEADVMGGLDPQALQPRLLLDYYSSHGVELALERYGVLARLRRQGFSELEVELDPSRREHQIVRVTGRRGEWGPRGRLLELVVRRRWLEIPERRPLEFLSLEWMLLQDPSAEFHLGRQALPGQERPGLGLAAEVIEMLVRACHRLGLAGLASRPAWYHSAAMAAREFRFLDPEAEGRFRAFQEALGGLSFEAASRAVDEGRLVADGEPVRWETADHVLPVAPEVSAWLESKTYAEAVAVARERWRHRGLSCAAPP